MLPQRPAKHPIELRDRTVMAWTRLIRFLDAENEVRYGDAQVDSLDDFYKKLEAGNLSALELDGSDMLSLSSTGKLSKVRKLLGPLTPKDVPILRCVGLNYATHSEFSPDLYATLME